MNNPYEDLAQAAYWMHGYLKSAVSDSALSVEVRRFSYVLLREMYKDNPSMKEYEKVQYDRTNL